MNIIFVLKHKPSVEVTFRKHIVLVGNQQQTSCELPQTCAVTPSSSSLNFLKPQTRPNNIRRNNLYNLSTPPDRHQHEKRKQIEKLLWEILILRVFIHFHSSGFFVLCENFSLRSIHLVAYVCGVLRLCHVGFCFASHICAGTLYMRTRLPRRML